MTRAVDDAREALAGWEDRPSITRHSHVDQVRQIERMGAALRAVLEEASTRDAEWEYEYRPVHTSGEEWAGRPLDAAKETALAYPWNWTFAGEENDGPNGITHINTYRRRPAGPWELVSGVSSLPADQQIRDGSES